MALQLQDKVAIVTGSSSGLGQVIALLFAKRGAKVTLCGRDQERLKSTYDQAVEASGGHEEMFTTVQGDLNESSVRKEIVSKTIEKFGRLDILVANAGITVPKCNIREATEEKYDMLMNTNLKSVFFLIQQALPELEKTKGNIISISSMLSTLLSAPSIIYPMSKAALDHLTRCLALDLGPKGIRVNTVNPCFIPTRVWRSYGEDFDRKAREFAAMETQIQPLQGRAATADDVAEAVAFLASDSAGFITGESLKVDGGRSFAEPYGRKRPE